ncbi:MAG: TRM11 family SAM-dependent methyltransferase [Micromonosporaceae bacterium]
MNPPRTEHQPVPAAMWRVSPRSDTAQRGKRYLPESAAHPQRTLPDLAARIIASYSRPGDLVVDPLAGIGTALVEAAWQDRRAIGIEICPQWASLATANLNLARRQGAPGDGLVVQGDARHLPDLLPDGPRYRAGLITFGLPGPTVPGGLTRRARQLRRWAASHHQPASLDRLPSGELGSALAELLTGCAALLRPGGAVVVHAQHARRGRNVIDLPQLTIAAARPAGLAVTERHAVRVPRSDAKRQVIVLRRATAVASARRRPSQLSDTHRRGFRRAS